ASMLVTKTQVIGTIGGGALEFDAIKQARELCEDRLEHLPLGPALGQCCGGMVTVLSEVWDASRLARVEDDIVARPLPGSSCDMPLRAERVLAKARNEGQLPAPGIVDEWMIEPVAKPTREIWIWGAGHVGRALVSALDPLPDVQIKWADSARNRFPDDTLGIASLIAENPADLVPLAADHSEHFVLTYSHALDLEICHRILGRPFGALGLIGSATKWARFQSRLKALGYSEVQIDRIQCPIGDPSLGKHPQEIALGVAVEIVRRGKRQGAAMNSKSA
ncbi:MAG: xanthine dehydrogenase accessory protein XdhC, partial [Erythrobacter sp.]